MGEPDDIVQGLARPCAHEAHPGELCQLAGQHIRQTGRAAADQPDRKTPAQLGPQDPRKDAAAGDIEAHYLTGCQAIEGARHAEQARHPELAQDGRGVARYRPLLHHYPAHPREKPHAIGQEPGNHEEGAGRGALLVLLGPRQVDRAHGPSGPDRLPAVQEKERIGRHIAGEALVLSVRSGRAWRMKSMPSPSMAHSMSWGLRK